MCISWTIKGLIPFIVSMCTGTLSYKKSAATGISRDNLGAAERHHIAGEIEVSSSEL